MCVNYNAKSAGLIGISFQFSLTRRFVVCRGDSNEYTQHTI